MDIGVAGPIFTPKKALWDNNVHTPQDGSNILWEVYLFMEL